MEFLRLESGERLVRGHDAMPAGIRDALDEHLESEGMDPWEADNTVPAATFVRTWYSPTVGFMHDCAGHLPAEAVPGCADSEPVIVVYLRSP